MTTLKTSLNERPATDTPFTPTATIPKSNVQDAIEYAIANATVAALDDVGDVTITANTAGELLSWSGAAWINQTLGELDILTATAASAAYQPLDADLTSWAALTRASGFDTFVATPSSANLAALVTGETGTGALMFGTSPSITTDIRPASHDGASLGTSALGWSDLFLGTGGVITWGAASTPDVTITHSADTLTFAGGTNYSFDSLVTGARFVPSGSTVPTNGMYLPAANTLGWGINSAAELALTETALYPASNDGLALGISSTNAWSDLFLASGGQINWSASDVSITHSSGTLTTTGKLSIQNGSSTGVFSVGADLNATTLTNATRKLGRMTTPGYNTADLPMAVFSGDADAASSSIHFGGVPGSASIAACTVMNFMTAAATNTAAGTIRAVITSVGRFGVGTQSPDRLFHAEFDSATTNAVSQVLRITSTSSGTPATGIGVGMEFEVETAAGNNEVGATINAVTTDVTSTSEDFDLVFNTMAAGAAAAERMRITSAGAVQPGSNDGGPLGVSGTAWSDLFLASGGVVNWNAGNTTLTHSANQLQVEPANFVVYRNSLSIVTIGDPPNLGFPGIWFGVTPASATYSNYSFLYDLFNGPIFNAASTFSLQFRINNVTQVVLDANGKWRPSSNGGSSLGISGTAWSDLWLASAGKISFNADDVTITHSSNALAFTGASSGYSFDSNVGIGATTPDRKLHVENDSATTNAVSQVFRMTSTSSGTPATGIGVGMEFEVETAAGNNEVGATINAVTTDVTSTSEDFDLVFNTMAAGATAAERMRVLSTGAVTIQGVATVAAATATPAAGSTSARLLFGTTAGFGIYYGSGAPTVSAAQGSLYLRSDGSTTTTRMYVNTNGSTTWTNLITTA